MTRSRFGQKVKTRSIRVVFALVLLSSPWTYAAKPRKVTDALGTSVNVAGRPARVVPLAPSLAELVADLTGDDYSRIVGVTDHSDYPPPLSKITSVGPYPRFNLEKVVSLRPDLILATTDGNAKDQIDHLRELGLPVIVVRGDTVAQVENSIRIVGNALGEQRRAESLLSRLSQGIANFRARAKARTAHARPVRVMLQLWDNPLIVVGGHSFLSDALTVVGAENVYANATNHYPKVSIEDALQKNPDVIILLSMSGGTERKVFATMAKHWAEFPWLKAVKEKRVEVLRDDGLLRPTLRLLEGISGLERAIYGSK